MKRICLFILLISVCVAAEAQYNPLQPPATFRSTENPLYWKNKLPHPGYWQQDVEYSIKAKLDDQKNRIDGEMQLVYFNNSPDALTELFFHVYQNAFEPGSYNSEVNDHKFQKGDTLHQHTEVTEMTVDGNTVTMEQDNTLIRVKLNKPLVSGSSVVVDCRFATQFDAEYDGRMKVYTSQGIKHFNVVHWYPRISVYDRKFGWTTDQHLGYEFYGDFGSFDVEITLPEHYVLDATGNLLNRSEVLPKELREKLDIKNFASKPWGEAPSQIIAPSQKQKTWKFHAENVHDFAWTADPSYRIGEATATLTDGTTVSCIALAQEQHASGWQNAAYFTAKVIETYSRDFGPYAYHKMIVADARDGMEYPMLTLDGGRDPGYRGLLAHEVGHNWFFGMVGNNETYRAALDEGFTEFLTSWALERIGKAEEGKSIEPLSSGQVIKLRNREVYNGYYRSAITKNDDPALNTHSAEFEHPSGYGQVYSKTATMLYNLQYVLGDSLFQAAISHYFNQWKFCHPYLDDFRSSVIQFTGRDLNWFFDQWLETDKKLDYRITKVRRTKNENEYRIVFKRKGGMQMPLDFTIEERNGTLKSYHIPNTWFEKHTEATVLPRWTGSGDLRPTYEVLIQTEGGLSSIAIDTTERFADVYQLDNRLPFPVALNLDRLKKTRPDYSRYTIRWRPDLWYNGYDGLKVGVQLSSDYVKTYHKVDVGFWVSTGFGQQTDALLDQGDEDDFNRFSYRVNYESRLRHWDESITVSAGSKWLAGLAGQKAGFSKAFSNDKTRLGLNVQSLYRPLDSDLNYLLYSDQWASERFNNFLEAHLEHRYRKGANTGLVRFEVRSPFIWSDYNYSWLRMETKNDQFIDRFLLRVRTFLQWGEGNNWAPESQLFLAGASPEELMDGAFTRAQGFVPRGLYGLSNETGNFQVGGGLGLRGYNNYVVPELNEDGLVRLAYASQSGAALNLELEFDDYFPIVIGNSDRYLDIQTYAFADAGIIALNRSYETVEFSEFRMDAGLGVALDIKRWWKYSALKPLSIRADFPLFLNRPPASEEYFQFRWLLGIQRAF